MVGLFRQDRTHHRRETHIYKQEETLTHKYTHKMETANITKNDLMENYNISLSKIDKDIKSNKLSYVKIGRAVRFRGQDIENYIMPSTSI